jgi:hypothetical protein
MALLIALMRSRTAGLPPDSAVMAEHSEWPKAIYVVGWQEMAGTFEVVFKSGIKSSRGSPEEKSPIFSVPILQWRAGCGNPARLLVS